MKLRVLVERVENGYVATVRDDCGEIAHATSRDPSQATTKATFRAAQILDLSEEEFDAVDLEVAGLTENVEKEFDDGDGFDFGFSKG
jgi:hypothetical protein